MNKMEYVASDAAYGTPHPRCPCALNQSFPSNKHQTLKPQTLNY